MPPLPWPSFGISLAYPREAGRPTDIWLHAGILRDDNALRVETAHPTTSRDTAAGFCHEAR